MNLYKGAAQGFKASLMSIPPENHSNKVVKKMGKAFINLANFALENYERWCKVRVSDNQRARAASSSSSSAQSSQSGAGGMDEAKIEQFKEAYLKLYVENILDAMR